MREPTTPVELAFDAMGYRPYLLDYTIGWQKSGAPYLHGVCDPRLVIILTAEPRFLHGVLYGCHTDVGKHLIDFRSLKGKVCDGSLQVVIAREPVAGGLPFYSDIDKYNPYEDLVGACGHLFGEVVIPAVFEEPSPSPE